MRKIILLLTSLFISINVVADDAPFSNAPAPAQSYHSVSDSSANSTSTTSVVNSSPSVDSSAPMTAAQPAASSQAATTTSVNSPVYNTDQNQNTVAQDQAAQLTEATLAYEQQTNQHIQNLDANNQAIGAEMQTLEQNTKQLQQEVSQLETKHPSQLNFNSILHSFSHQDVSTYIELGGIASFLLLFGMLMGRLFMQHSPRVAVANHSSAHKVGDLLADDTKSEYDFMGTAAAIPAKLDLARSYIAMSDYDQARSVLKTVLEKGDEEQRLVAEALISKIEKREMK